MNCHGNNDNNNGNANGKHKGHLSHMLMMALCCGAPILILLAVPLLIKNGSTGLAGTLSLIAPFLCPLMMVFMMPMMMRGNKDKQNKNEYPQSRPMQLEENTHDK